MKFCFHIYLKLKGNVQDVVQLRSQRSSIVMTFCLYLLSFVSQNVLICKGQDKSPRTSELESVECS